MKKVVIFVQILLLAIGWNICPIEGFIPNDLLAFAAKAASFSTKDVLTHQDMTRNALLDVATEVLRDNPNPNYSESTQRLSALDPSSLKEKSILTAYYGVCDKRRKKVFKDAVKAVQKANENTDLGDEEKHLAAAHFDSEQFQSGQERLIALRQSVVSLIKSKNYDEARRGSGRMFHTLQDFYSHSSWVENGNRAPNPVLGKLNERIDNVAGPTQQTCTDCEKKLGYYECVDNIVESLKNNGVLTSGYGAAQTDYDGKVIEKTNGKCSHGGLFIDSKQDTPARGGINKDSPYFLNSPHYYLYDEAAALAIQATADMLRNMRRDVNNDQLFGEYLGVFESRASAGRTGSQVYSGNRNAMLQHHLNRIEGKALTQPPLKDAILFSVCQSKCECMISNCHAVSALRSANHTFSKSVIQISTLFGGKMRHQSQEIGLN